MITPGTLLITGVVAAVIFGTKRLRNIGEDLGVALRNFRKGLHGEAQDSNDSLAPSEIHTIKPVTDEQDK